MRVYTHRGLGTPTASQHNIFDSEKLSQIFHVLQTQAGFEPTVFGSSPDALPTDLPHHTNFTARVLMCGVGVGIGAGVGVGVGRGEGRGGGAARLVPFEEATSSLTCLA